jgi:hypothetical protein
MINVLVPFALLRLKSERNFIFPLIIFQKVEKVT